MLLDQQGKRFNRAHDRQAPCTAALLTYLNVTIENAALIEHAWPNGCDGSNDREEGTGAHHPPGLGKTGQQDRTPYWPATTTQWLCRVCGGGFETGSAEDRAIR